MTHPESQERKIMKLDMEMIEPDDKTTIEENARKSLLMK